MKDKIVIIGANDFQNQLILKAKSMGYETHVFAWKQDDIGEKTADKFYPISIIEKSKILDVCKSIKPKGILSIGSDLAMLTVNYIANKMNLVGNSMYSTDISTNKYKMRQTFIKNGDPCPISYLSDGNINVDNLPLPVIVKPTDRSGSRGITKVSKKEEIEKAVKKSINESFEKKALIEEFITGKEYSVEFISYKGNHKFLALTEKFTTGSPYFIETGHFQPAQVSEDLMNNIIDIISKALNSLDIKNGASHSEIKIDELGNINIIEIGARMGGDCIGSDLVEISTGYDFVKMVIDVSLGKKPDFSKKQKSTNAAIKFIFNELDYSMMENIEKNNKDIIIYKNKIEKIENVIDSSSRWGFYIIADEDREKLEKVLETK